ncbi:MAG: hypothetical protein HZA20_01190 [Nitrospirae bacterium]|jgi:hypothetical protein|nr:hypothetical protein [Nitrospirota bacterium]
MIARESIPSAITPALALAFILAAVLIAVVSLAAASDMVVNTQIDSVSKSGTVSIVSARVGIENDTGGAINNVVGRIVSIGDGVVLNDDAVTFSDIASGASAVSIDTFTVTIDSAVEPSLNVAIPLDITWQDANGTPQKQTAHLLVNLEQGGQTP